jgi:protein SCO1
MQNNKITKIIIILSLIIAALSAYILLVVELPNKPLAGQGGGNINEDVPIGGDFVLTDQNGDPFSSDKMKGHLSLVYFGFTYCPDICPTTLNKLSNVITTLDKYNIDVMPIFITIDPARDTPKLLKEYLRHFSDKFIGLSGDDKELKHVTGMYKVFYARVDNAKHSSSNNYMLDHSSFIYLMDKKGKYMKHFYTNSTEEEIIEYIRLNK